MKNVRLNFSNIKPFVKQNIIKGEIWKDIPNYEGLYQASNKGRIRHIYLSKQKGNKTLLKSSIRNTSCINGYLQLNLCKNNIHKNFRVHRLIALTFIPNPNNYPEINHIDENKQNNCVENLEWCTRDYNNKYSKNIAIIQYDINGNFIKEWNSITEAAISLNINKGNIQKCCNNKYGYKTVGGFKWKYK